MSSPHNVKQAKFGNQLPTIRLKSPLNQVFGANSRPVFETDTFGLDPRLFRVLQVRFAVQDVKISGDGQVPGKGIGEPYGQITLVLNRPKNSKLCDRNGKFLKRRGIDVYVNLAPGWAGEEYEKQNKEPNRRMFHFAHSDFPFKEGCQDQNSDE